MQGITYSGTVYVTRCRNEYSRCVIWKIVRCFLYEGITDNVMNDLLPMNSS